MAEINVTPLVDVMLVLLIIFMVTAPMMTTGVPVNLPSSSAKQLDAPSEPVEMSIDRRGRVFIGKAEIPPGGLSEALAGIAKQNADRQILLSADTALDYGKVAAVMGEMSGAGLSKVSLVTAGQQR